MRALSKSECRDWCSAHGIALDALFGEATTYGIEEPLIEKPGHVLTRAEFEDMVSLVTLAVLFLWDCYVLTPGGRPAIRYSHDEMGDAVF